MSADVHERWDDDTLARSQWCLDDHRSQLGAVVEALLVVDASLVGHAVDIVAALPRSSACIDEAGLSRAPPPPDAEIAIQSREIRAQLARARVAMNAGDYPRGHTLIEPALRRAKDLAWPPLSAAARRLRAELLAASGDFEQAEAEATHAYVEAAQVGAWDVASSAATDLVSLLGYRQKKPGEAKGWARDAQLAIGFAGDPSGLRQAKLLSSRAMVEARRFATERALELFGEALTLRQAALGANHPNLAGVIGNIATMHYRLEQYDQAEPLFVRSLEISIANLGPEHPNVARKFNNLGRMYMKVDKLEQAREALGRALAIRRNSLPAGHFDIGQTLHNLAGLHLQLGELARAQQAVQEAASIRRQDPEAFAYHSTLSLHATIAERQGQVDEARTIYQELIGLVWIDAENRHSYLVRLAALELEAGAEAEAARVMGQAIARGWALRSQLLAKGAAKHDVDELDAWLQKEDPRFEQKVQSQGS